MNKKSLATALVLASAVFAASATPVVKPITTDTSIGTVTFGTDYAANDGGNVSWTVSAKQPVGSFFTDTYDFKLLVSDDVTAGAQIVSPNPKFYAFANNAGELQLYSGTFLKGSSLSSYTLIDQISFGVSPDALVDHLAAGNYFYAVEGRTAGTKGAQYSLDVAAAVPEPANAALLLAGLCLVGTLAKRRKTN